MAYDAVRSLLRTIEDSYLRFMDPILQSAFDHAKSLEHTLKVCRKGVKEEIRRFEDTIGDSFSNFHRDVDSFVKTAKKMKEMMKIAYATVHSLVCTIEKLVDSSRAFMDSLLKSAFDQVKSLEHTLQVCKEVVGDMDEQMIIIEDSFDLDVDSFVKKMKEMMEMAYSAVHSLRHKIEVLLDSARTSMDPLLKSAFDHANSLERTLEDCKEGVGDMDEQMIIIEAARRLEDAIEISLLPQSPTVSSNLDGDINSFIKTAKKMMEVIEGSWEKKAAKMIEDDVQELFVQKPDLEEEEEDVEMVGLGDQFLQIRDYLLAGEERFCYDRVVWISGMAGIGKTLLARKIFDDPLVKRNFQYQAFVKVGENCQSEATLLRAIMEKVNLDEESSLTVLILRKILLVLDDVWDETLISPLLQEILQLEDEKGILIMVTGRTDPIYPFWKVKMRFMNEEESWELLKRKVFEEEEFYCPPQLVEYGKEIAKKCEGLPLLINTVAPILLSQAQKIPEHWRRIANKPNPVLEEASYQISEVLFSSYHNLISEEYKMIFLYIVAFPLSSVISLSRIMGLCSAEKFVIVGDNDYNGLIRYNLVIGHHKNWNGFVYKACSLHYAYWFPSKRLAENNKFLHIINNLDCADESVKTHRRLVVHYNALLAMREVHDEISSIPTVRSLLCTGAYHPYHVPLCWEWKLLRILDALTIRFYEFPNEVVQLVRLRYLAFSSNAEILPSISKLEKLEFLIVHQHSSIKQVAVESRLPVEIWNLHQLQHLEILGRNIPEPPHPGMVLPNLAKLLGVGVESYTKGVLESLPRLKKLRIQTEMAPNAARTLSLFDHVSYSIYATKFQDSSFQCVVMNPTLLRPPPPLSISKSGLRKLTLSGFGYPWEEMSKIAEFLPELHVLKLQSNAFRGEKWEAKRNMFEGLDYLVIDDTDLVQWITGDETFLSLSRLTMRNCYKLREIPTGFPQIEDIEMVDCNPRAEAFAKENYDVKSVTISAKYSWKEKLKS